MNISPPQSDTATRRRIFEAYAYRPFHPRVEMREQRSVFVRLGLALPNVFGNTFLTYHYPIVFFKSTVLSVLSVLKRGVRPVEVPIGKVPAIIHSGWTGGYYHWITESLPRALVLQDCFPDSVPLLPLDVYRRYLPSLMAIGFADVIAYPEGANAVCDRAVLTECPRIFGTTSPELLQRVRDRVRENFSITQTDALDLVYVSRSRSRGRKVINEDAVVELVRDFGGRVVHFEEMTFEDQVRLMASCRILVGIHGAGLTNMMFMPPGGTVIEILAKRNGIFDYRKIGNSFKHQACYWRLAEAMGHRHEFILGQPNMPSYRRTDMADVAIAIEHLETALLEAGARRP